MPKFRPGDEVSAPHPHDPVSNQRYPGKVTRSREQKVADEVHEVVEIEFEDGAVAEMDAGGVDHADHQVEIESEDAD